MVEAVATSERRSLLLQIAICEDQKQELDALRSLLEAELVFRHMVGEVLTFANGETMLAAMQGKAFPINFLDIYMNQLTGIEVAREIRAHDERAAIVFITSSPDYRAEGFDVGAVHYLVKPYTTEAVRVALDRCFLVTGTAERFIEVTAGGGKYKLLLSKIHWVESQDKSCIIHLPEESLRVYLKLDEVFALIDDDFRFRRCHRSFIVNLDHAAAIKENDFVMKDGSLVAIRREDKARIKKIYEDYFFEKQRRAP